MKYPEHEKLGAIKDKSQAIGDFLAWLGEKKSVVLAEWEPRQRRMLSGRFGHNRVDQRMYPTPTPMRDLLAEFFDINRNKIESERSAMLDEMRAINDRST